jgi:hypothetical protein
VWFLFSVNISSTLWLFLYTGAVLLHDLDASELPTIHELTMEFLSSGNPESLLRKMAAYFSAGDDRERPASDSIDPDFP